MIIFSGELNNNNKKFIKKQQLKVAIILASLMILFGCFPVGILASILFQMKLAGYIFFALSTAFIIIINFFGKSIGDYPNEIIITEEDITAKTKKCEMKAPINKVTEILDTGDSFIFKFHFPRFNSHFVCQKDLINKGSLEDFERMFEGKITSIL